MDVDLIYALQCAIRVIDGDAGGYTQEEIQQAKYKLMNHILELEKQK